MKNCYEMFNLFYEFLSRETACFKQATDGATQCVVHMSGSLYLLGCAYILLRHPLLGHIVPKPSVSLPSPHLSVIAPLYHPFAHSRPSKSAGTEPNRGQPAPEGGREESGAAKGCHGGRKEPGGGEGAIGVVGGGAILFFEGGRRNKGRWNRRNAGNGEERSGGWEGVYRPEDGECCPYSFLTPL